MILDLLHLPDCSFHWITSRSTPGEAFLSSDQAILTLRDEISRIVRFWGVGGGSRKENRYSLLIKESFFMKISNNHINKIKQYSSPINTYLMMIK